MPKRNYGFEKRQKELNRQRKQEEKRLRKQERADTADQTLPPEETAPEPDADR